MKRMAKFAMTGALVLSAPAAFADDGLPSTETTEEALRADEHTADTSASEANDICEAACAGTHDAAGCEASCVEETMFCFDQCAQLAAGSADCFLGCTNIAVDFRERYTAQEEGVLDDPRMHDADAEPGEHRYGRKLAVGVNVRGYVHNVPNFALGIFLDRYISHWDDKAKFIYGGELLFRFDDRNDFIIGVDYADFRTPDGWWLEKDEELSAADWVQNDLRTVTVSLEWNGIANLDKKKRAQIYGGVGLGAAIRLGNFRKNEMSVGCLPPNATMDIFDGLTPSSPCPAAPGQDTVLDGSSPGEANEWENMKIPPVLPSLIASLGFRYLIADTVSIGIEGGFKTAAFYGGLEVGVVFGKKYARSDAASAP